MRLKRETLKAIIATFLIVSKRYFELGALQEAIGKQDAAKQSYQKTCSILGELIAKKQSSSENVSELQAIQNEIKAKMTSIEKSESQNASESKVVPYHHLPSLVSSLF